MLEKDVLRAVGQLLAYHPRVAFMLRMNSGMASYNAANGKYAPVWFHLWVKPRDPMRMSDFMGATVDAKIIALECKRPGWKKPTDQREREQLAFLQCVKRAGGIAAFVTSVEEANEALSYRN